MVSKYKFLLLLRIKLVIAIAALTSIQSLAAYIDPTKPFGVTGSSNNSQLKNKAGFKLTSIIHGDGIHTAVINGKIYQMFDYLGEYRITGINSHSVILRSKVKRLKLKIFNSKGFQSKVVENTVAK